jgi:hypothetical protein
MSTQPALPFISTYDISKGRDNESSKVANPSDESKANQRAAILEFIESRESEGTTLCDIQRRFGWEKNTFSGRLTELRQSGKLNIFGRRERCSVYYAVKG